MSIGINAIDRERKTNWSPPVAPMATRSSFWRRTTGRRFASTKRMYVRVHGTSCARRARHGPGRGDYIVGMAVTPKERKKAKGRRGESEESLILSVTEQGYGKRTDVDEYRLPRAAARASST
jgi:DNA gyrase/topoisomerase IV subunit A